MANVFERKAELEEYEKKEDLYKSRKVAYKKDDMRLLLQMLKKLGKGNPDNKRRKRIFSGGGNFDTLGKKQLVVFKSSYSFNKKLHERYLKKYMPQEDKKEVIDKPELFGTDEETYNANMTALHRKCIISPENQNVDLKFLTEEFVRRMEGMTGYKFYWRACIHNDTNHRHVHLCLNGKDASGKKVYFQPEMIKKTMRETLSYITTLMVGERTHEEIEASRARIYESKRWTKLDEQLELYGKRLSQRQLSGELAKRIEFLAFIGLAKRNNEEWILKDDWKDVLTATGRYNTFLEEYMKSDGKLSLYSGGEVHGKVVKVITFDKDESWNDAVLVSQDDGTTVYVPVWQLKKDEITGKEVSISGGTKGLSKQVKDSDIKVIETESVNIKETPEEEKAAGKKERRRNPHSRK